MFCARSHDGKKKPSAFNYLTSFSTTLFVRMPKGHNRSADNVQSKQTLVPLVTCPIITSLFLTKSKKCIYKVKKNSVSKSLELFFIYKLLKLYELYILLEPISKCTTVEE